MNRYHYVLKNKLTSKVVDFKIYNVSNSPNEMEDFIRQYNEYRHYEDLLEPVTDPTMKEVIELAFKWKTSASLKDLIEELQSINNQISSVSDEIRDHLEPQPYT